MKRVFLKNLCAVLITAVGVSAASAASVSSQFFAGINALSDNSAEYLINADGSVCGVAGGNCTLDQGDRLVGIFQIETIEQAGTTRTLGQGGVNELTGIFDITVTNATNLVGNTWSFAFAATDATGVVVSLFEDSTPDYERTDAGGADKLARIAALKATADNGSLWMELEISAVSFWTALSTVGNDVSIFSTIAFPGTGGFFNVGMDIVTNNSGLTFGKVNCQAAGGGPVDVCGAGSLIGIAGQVTPYDSFDNIDFSVNVIPEPGSLALFSLGLLGLAAVRRRRGD